MKKKILFIVLVIVGLFTFTGCGKSVETTKEKAKNNIEIHSKDKNYYTTFKSDKFIQKKPEYMQIDSEDLGVFISFQYIESSKETYDYYKTHNLFGNEYGKGDTKDYKWNKYDGYTYNIEQNSISFRVLLKDDAENSIVLSGYVGSNHTKDLDFTKDFDNKDIQSLLNTMKFIDE